MVVGIDDCLVVFVRFRMYYELRIFGEMLKYFVKVFVFFLVLE